jgi:hypothetical protein
MNQEQPAWYEPHPVTMERKQELRARGVRIIDAQFKPDGYVNPGEEAEDADTNSDGKLSVAEIREALTEKGVEFDPKAKKADLLALLNEQT